MKWKCSYPRKHPFLQGVFRFGAALCFAAIFMAVIALSISFIVMELLTDGWYWRAVILMGVFGVGLLKASHAIDGKIEKEEMAEREARKAKVEERRKAKADEKSNKSNKATK